MAARCRCTSAPPKAAVLFPAVVVIQHQSGVDQFIQAMTGRLADAGFVAAAPDLYHRDGPNCPDDMRTRSSRLSDRRVVADVSATVEFLKRQRTVDAGRIGIVGFCMGGRIVYLTAAASPSLKPRLPFIRATLGALGAAIFHRRSSVRAKSAARCRAISATTTKIRRRKIASSSTPSWLNMEKSMNFTLTPTLATDSWTTPRRAFGRRGQVAWPRALDFLRRYLAHRFGQFDDAFPNLQSETAAQGQETTATANLGMQFQSEYRTIGQLICSHEIRAQPQNRTCPSQANHSSRGSEERRRISRELHDRVCNYCRRRGCASSVAARSFCRSRWP